MCNNKNKLHTVGDGVGDGVGLGVGPGVGDGFLFINFVVNNVGHKLFLFFQNNPICINL